MQNHPVIHAISKFQIMSALNIRSRTTLSRHIKNSGLDMPEFWQKRRVFVGVEVIELEKIFNVKLISIYSLN